MARLQFRESVLIQQTVNTVFQRAEWLVRNYTRYFPNYRAATILKDTDGEIVFRRKCWFFGKNVEWLSVGKIEKGSMITLVQDSGPLPGMVTSWKFASTGRDTTHAMIEHRWDNLGIAGSIKCRLIYYFIIRKIARKILDLLSQNIYANV